MKRLLSIVALLYIVMNMGNARENTSLRPHPTPSYFVSARSQSFFNYDLSTFITSYMELDSLLATSVNNGHVWDEPTYQVPMEFPFELNGHAVTTWHFNGSGSSIASNTQIP